jgi:N-acyl homoserine lactone hydrolase
VSGPGNRATGKERDSSHEHFDRVGGPPLLLTGDLTYGTEILQRGQLPGVGNRLRLAESSHKVLTLTQQQPGLVVLPADDPTAAQRLLDS